MVPILSQNDSSLSSFLGSTGVRGDFGRGDDISYLPNKNKVTNNQHTWTNS